MSNKVSSHTASSETSLTQGDFDRDRASSRSKFPGISAFPEVSQCPPSYKTILGIFPLTPDPCLQIDCEPQDTALSYVNILGPVQSVASGTQPTQGFADSKALPFSLGYET